MLRIGGELIISARTIVNSIQFMFMSGFFGLIDAATPMVSYAYGERNKTKLLRTMKQLMVLITGLFAFIFALHLLGSRSIVSLYLSHEGNPPLEEAILKGLQLVPLGFLFFGYNIGIRAMFTAVNNTRVATMLSIPETLIFPNLTMLTLPFLLGADGVWWCFPATQLLTFLITTAFAVRSRDLYGYGKSGIATALEN